MSDFKFAFPRYLQSKRELDERSINHHVRQTLISATVDRSALRVVDLGAGSGVFFERLHSWYQTTAVDYTAVEAEAENVAVGRAHFADAANVRFHQGTAEQFLRDSQGNRFDLVTAHSFMDLVDVDALLALIKPQLAESGLFYTTLNFDGVTSFEPSIDHEFDSLIEQRYHHSMDSRCRDGMAIGDSRTGRHLFGALPKAGFSIIAAGSSDWIVFPTEGRYRGDEAYFLRCILHWVEQVLTGDPLVDQGDLKRWLATRIHQVANGQLVYIAHQHDLVAMATGG